MKKDIEMMERLIRNINHEIKNPLTVIRGYAQLLTMKKSEVDFQKKTGNIIMENVDLIDERISALYRAFSSAPESAETVNVAKEVFGIIQSYGEDVEKKIKVSGENSLEASLCRIAFRRVIDCLILGFNWKEHPASLIHIIVGMQSGRTSLNFHFLNADFSCFHDELFYLPFSEKTYFKGGTELFEVYFLSHANGWDFSIVKDGETSGFLVIL
jgi:hypothetical protein